MAKSSEERLQRGVENAKAFFGETYFNKLAAGGSTDPDLFKRTAQEFVMENCFSSYDRPGLVFRERSLMNLAMLIALNRGSELKIHIRGALHNGLSEESICEACRHAMIYCGVPAGRDALLIASSVIAEMKESGELS